MTTKSGLGQFLRYTWMALPFTDPTAGDPPTGDQSWTCFLSAANFKGPIAYYIPETWSKIGKLFNYPFLYGRGLDARPGVMGGGAMEINTVPRLESKDARGTTYSKLPKLQFPVDAEGRPVHRQARGRLRGDLPVVSLCGPTVLPAIQVERGEESETAGFRGEGPRNLAGRP